MSARKCEMHSACVGHLGCSCVLKWRQCMHPFPCLISPDTHSMSGFAIRKWKKKKKKPPSNPPKNILYSMSHWKEMEGGAILRAFTSSLLLGDCFPCVQCSSGSQQLPHLYSSIEGNLRSRFVPEKEKQTWMGAYFNFPIFLRRMQEYMGDNYRCQGQHRAWNVRDLRLASVHYSGFRTAMTCFLQRALWLCNCTTFGLNL